MRIFGMAEPKEVAKMEYIRKTKSFFSWETAEHAEIWRGDERKNHSNTWESVNDVLSLSSYFISMIRITSSSLVSIRG